MLVRATAMTLSLCALAACATHPDTGSEGRVVPLVNGAGHGVGTVTIVEHGAGVTLRLTVKGLPAGAHGVHLHEAGRCDGPDFKSAGAHWNPAARQHGHLNPEGAHVGDLPNFTITSLDVGTVEFAVGELRSAGGLSLVVHAKPDDYRTDPSGNSGDRIACAVLYAPMLGTTPEPPLKP